MTERPLWLKLVGNVFTWLVFCTLSCSGNTGNTVKAGNAGNSSYYIYSTVAEKHYVQEVTSGIDARPNFLYSPDYPNGRVVTYYAHWCPHCKLFKPTYIEFANKIHELSEKFHVLVETFAVSCVPQKHICIDNNIRSYPYIMFYPPNSINGTRIKPWDLKPEEIFRMSKLSRIAETDSERRDGPEKIVSSGPEKIISAVQQSSRSRKTNEKQTKIRQKPYFIQRTRDETFHDAHLSFHFAMNTAIFTQPGPLAEKPKKALLEFLVAVQKTIPFDSSMHAVVYDLIENFETAASGPRALNTIMAKHRPPRPITEWSRASSQHGTGYTAGLWMLFHIMSVGFVQWNHMAMDDGQKIIPATMANTLRNFIEHFFLCEECRLHFLADFDACMFDRCNRLATSTKGGTLQQYIQFPLWLYETHNAVNTRLRKERIEQNVEKGSLTTPAEVVWPPASSCRSCWLSREKDRWDEFEVFKFLQQSYWLEDERSSDLLEILSAGRVGAKSIVSAEHNELGGNYSFQFNTSFIGPLCWFVLTAFVWYRYRRRRYNLIGLHKKI